MKTASIAAAMALALTAPAYVEEITNHTLCSVAVEAFNNRNMDLVRDTSLFIENTMEYLYSMHIDNGELGILAQMTVEAKSYNVALTVEYCRKHPRATIYSEAQLAYQGLRALERSFH